jgi:hypothetical protein
MPLDETARRAIAAIDGPQANEKSTPEGNAQEKGAPSSEAKEMSASPIFEFDLPNGQKRAMSKEQILGMAERYSKLNHKHATLKPVTDVIENFLQSNPNMSPAELAQTLQQLAAGGGGQTQFGKGGINDPDGDGTSKPGKRQERATPVSDDDFSRWETENASTLPPGYRDMHLNMRQMAEGMHQMMAMMQQVMGASAGHVDAARTAQQQSRQQQGQSIQATIGNNLDRAQAALKLPDESANDFMMFAQQRGYSFEDFVDPQLTYMVMQDFANNMQSPEMERMRQIHSRRTAYTSTAGQAPMGGGSQMSPEQKDFAEFADRTISQRQL